MASNALGGIAYLAVFSIGANIGIAYGTVNAIFGIMVAAVIIFAMGFPLAYYAAHYNIDLDHSPVALAHGGTRRLIAAVPPWQHR